MNHFANRGGGVVGNDLQLADLIFSKHRCAPSAVNDVCKRSVLRSCSVEGKSAVDLSETLMRKAYSLFSTVLENALPILAAWFCMFSGSIGLAGDEDFPTFDEVMRNAAEKTQRGARESRSAPTAPSTSPPRASTELRLPFGNAEERRRDDAADGSRAFRPESSGVGRQPGAPRDERRPENTARSDSFDWTEHFTSPADVRFPYIPDTGFRTSSVFDHGHAFLSVAEESAYLDMLEAIERQRRAVLAEAAGDLKNAAAGRAEWELAFYQFRRVRELAFRNGHLRARPQDGRIGGLPDPFAPIGPPAGTSDERYDLLQDINRFPEHFVGRPVVFYGTFRAQKIIRIGRDIPASVAIEPGPGEDIGGKRPDVAVLQGTLTGMDGTRQIAVIHTKGILTPQRGLLDVNSRRPSGEPIPVLVKGWVVKKWDSGPLIYCEALRQVSPIPHFSLIRQFTLDRQPLRREETWLYYETLRQMELTSAVLQRQTAASVLQQRISGLMQEVEATTAREVMKLRDALEAGKLSERQFKKQEAALKWRLNSRVARYRRYQERPEDFPVFVDLFQHPDVYHGHLVSMQGHVRHVISYSGDSVMFDGRTLHELWFYTDDSQHNPTVIVTPHLPSDFPVDADVIDRVGVTGCFFKQYVYDAQDTHRIAPLLLAGRITWRPTAEQVLELVEEGHLSARSPRAVKAAAVSRSSGRTGAITIGFLVILMIMILWGRTQREERDRLRLQKRLSELPEFHIAADDAFLGSDSDIDRWTSS